MLTDIRLEIHDDDLAEWERVSAEPNQIVGELSATNASFGDGDWLVLITEGRIKIIKRDQQFVRRIA